MINISVLGGRVLGTCDIAKPVGDTVSGTGVAGVWLGYCYPGTGVEVYKGPDMTPTGLWERFCRSTG